MTVKQVVCNYFNLTDDQICQKTRKRNIVYARYFSMSIYFEKYGCKDKFNGVPGKLSYEQIGAIHGGFDRCTVIHCMKTISNLIETDKDFKLQYDYLILLSKDCKQINLDEKQKKVYKRKRVVLGNRLRSIANDGKLDYYFRMKARRKLKIIKQC